MPCEPFHVSEKLSPGMATILRGFTQAGMTETLEISILQPLVFMIVEKDNSRCVFWYLVWEISKDIEEPYDSNICISKGEISSEKIGSSSCVITNDFLFFFLQVKPFISPLFRPFEGSSDEACKVKVKLLSRVRLFATPWTVAYQVPPSMGFSRQEYWSGLLFPSPMTFFLMRRTWAVATDIIPQRSWDF